LVDGTSWGDGIAPLRRGHQSAARDLREREIDNDRRLAAARRSERNGVCPEQRSLAAPGSHGAWRIAEDKTYKTNLCKPFDVTTGDPKMMRAREARSGQPHCAGNLRQARDRDVEGRVGETMLYVDYERPRPGLARCGDGEAIDLAGLRLRCIAWDACKPVSFMSVNLGLRQRPCYRRGIDSAGARGFERARSDPQALLVSA
jgi:hypothetical protein